MGRGETEYKIDRYLIHGDDRTPKGVLDDLDVLKKNGNQFRVGLQAQAFAESYEKGMFPWSFEKGGDRMLGLFDLEYAPTPRLLRAELKKRKLTFPGPGDALRFAETLAKRDIACLRKGKGLDETKAILFYHPISLWRREQIASALQLDLMRGTFRRIRCIPVPEEFQDGRLIGDCRFAGRVA